MIIFMKRYFKKFNNDKIMKNRFETKKYLGERGHKINIFKVKHGTFTLAWF